MENLYISEESLKNDEKLQAKFLDIVLEKKRNVLLHGPGGTGKSYLIVNILKKEVERINKVIAITSTTGVSALAIGGTTIHRWSGIKLGKESLLTITTRIKESNKDCYKRWIECKILVIDEVSMLGKKTFELLDNVAKSVCQNDLPFGGKQIILSGDFLQLPPVNDVFSFTSDVWNDLDFKIFRMIEPKRYPDVNHFNMLTRVRVAKHTKEDVKNLYARVDAYIDYIRKGGDKNEKIKPTRIYSLKKDVEQNNLDELSKLEGDTIMYNANDKFVSKKDVDGAKKKIKMTNKEIMDYTEFLDTIVDRQLYFKPGAQVMLTYNLAPDLGLVNGSRGVIISCEHESVTVFFKNGMTTKIAYNLYEFDDGKVKMMRYQLPLILAWAISIHKCQGATLDYAIMDLGPSIFAPGMAYVCLSRVRTLDGLLLSNFLPKKIMADPEALEFENSIREYDIEEKREGDEDPRKLTLTKNGKSVVVNQIEGVDKNLIKYLLFDCPEIYEMMTPDMWDKLKNINLLDNLDSEERYDVILGLLGLEACEEDEDDIEPGGNERIECKEGNCFSPKEDISSEED